MKKMFLRLNYLAAITLLLLPALTFAQAEQAQRARSIKISGLKAFQLASIKKIMNTRFPSAFAWVPFVRYPKYDESVLQSDVTNIRNFYIDNGFFETQVKYNAETIGKTQKVDIKINIVEGQRSRMKKVIIDYAGPLDEELKRSINSKVALSTYTYFNADAYEASKQSIENYLLEQGYPDTDVTGQVVVDRDAHAAEVTFTVSPGQKFFFGPTKVGGNETVDTRYILRELTYKEGNPFSLSQLYLSQQNIFKLGVFDNVLLKPMKESGKKDVPVDIRVEEAKKRTLQIGVGYGYEDKVRTQASWTKRYIFQTPNSFSITGKYSSLGYSGILEYDQPYLWARENSLAVTSGYKRDFFVSYSNEQISAQPKITRILSKDKNSQAYIAYDLEVNRPLSVDPLVRDMLIETNPGNYYFVSGFIAGITQAAVAEPLYPTRGHVLSLALEYSSFFLGSELDYLKVFSDMRFYYDPIDGLITSVRLSGGLIRPFRFTRDVPIFKRFFLGGSSSVRGYPFQSVGPKDATGQPLGGEYSVLGNAEVKYPIYKNLKGTVFLDAGDVYQTNFDFTFDTLKYATGLGALYLTPIGPVRLEFAFPFDSQTSVDIKNYTLYFSLGPSF
jgi:outer membrane protein assembly complex protein YaeT